MRLGFSTKSISNRLRENEEHESGGAKIEEKEEKPTRDIAKQSVFIPIQRRKTLIFFKQIVRRKIHSFKRKGKLKKGKGIALIVDT